ncbi:MAG: hypothetical protein MUC68_18100 [Burkholderiaceae bacterium]|nr:hypothetical protein [Burkholderiaceae bacterium]
MNGENRADMGLRFEDGGLRIEDQRAGAGAQPQVQQRGRQHAQQRAQRHAVQREERQRHEQAAGADARTGHGPARGPGAIGQRQQQAAEHGLLDQPRHAGLVQPGFERHARQAKAAEAHRDVVRGQQRGRHGERRLQRAGRVPQRDAGLVPRQLAQTHQARRQQQHRDQRQQRAAPVPLVA